MTQASLSVPVCDSVTVILGCFGLFFWEHKINATLRQAACAMVGTNNRRFFSVSVTCKQTTPIHHYLIL